MRFAALCILALLLGAPASAQSLYGPGGLFLHPTASVPPKGRLTPGVLVLPQHDPVADATRTWISGSLDYGLTDDLEVGLIFLRVTNWDHDDSFGGFFRDRLLTETHDRPAVAVGYTQLGFGDLNTLQGFLAVRKKISGGTRHPVIMNLGVQYVDEVDGIPKSEFQPFAGIEVGITSRLTFIAEGRPRMEQEFGTPLALTLSYKVTESWNLAVSWANNGRSDHPMFGFGAGFTLGARR